MKRLRFRLLESKFKLMNRLTRTKLTGSTSFEEFNLVKGGDLLLWECSFPRLYKGGLRTLKDLSVLMTREYLDFA